MTSSAGLRVVVAVGGAHSVAVGRSGRAPGVEPGHRGLVPEGGVFGGGVHRDAVALDLVGERLVVTVEVGREGHPHRPGRLRHDVDREVLVGQAGALVLRGDPAHREAHEALLVEAVHPGELAAVGDVLRVAVDVPGGLVRAGEAADLPLRGPVGGGRRRQTLEVVVAPLVAADGAGHGVLEGHRVALPLTPLRVGVVALTPAADVAAVVDVARLVDVAVDRLGGVGVALAVLDPDDRARGARS